MTKSYYAALEAAASMAPDLGGPGLSNATQFIAWAEPICILISEIYGVYYDQVTEDFTAQVKELQDIEDGDFE